MPAGGGRLLAALVLLALAAPAAAVEVCKVVDLQLVTQTGEFFLAGCRLIPEIVEVDISILIAGDDHHPHSCHNCAGGIGSVRGRRDQADITVALPIGFVKCPDTEEPGIFAL